MGPFTLWMKIFLATTIKSPDPFYWNITPSPSYFIIPLQHSCMLQIWIWNHSPLLTFCNMLVFFLSPKCMTFNQNFMMVNRKFQFRFWNNLIRIFLSYFNYFYWIHLSKYGGRWRNRPKWFRLQESRKGRKISIKGKLDTL